MELTLDDLELLLQAAHEKGRLSVVADPEITKAWDESLHPRGDDGKFINKNEISQAASNPAKAAELRGKVTDPKERAKLDSAINQKQSGQQNAAKNKMTGFGSGLGPKRSSSRQPDATATTGEHPAGYRPGILDTVELARGLRSGVLDEESRKELAERVQHHTAEELDDIRSHLGLRAGGRKAELATKILMAASGSDYPEQGYTGALPMKDGSIRHYEDGQLTHTTPNPMDGTILSRVTPEEAHALIEHHLSRGEILKPEVRTKLAHMLMHRMSYRDIGELKRRLGVRASGRKEQFANRILNLVEAKGNAELQNPGNPVNQPDPAGTLGSLKDRMNYIEGKQAVYGKGGVNPARQKVVDEAADRLRLAVQSPFAGFGKESAMSEVKEAVNDLYNTSEFLAAAHLAGIPLDAKDGKPVQQLAAAVHRLATAAHGDAESEPAAAVGQQKPINLLGDETSNTANHTHYVEGDTYPHRQAIKKAGGTWDKVARKWSIDEEGLQYLPDGLTGTPIPGRQPNANTPKPNDAPTVADQVKDEPPVAAPPTVPESAVKQAEALKKWHQQASRHEVHYDQMTGWDAKMMREGDAKQRADSAKKMAVLIRKHPDLFTDYGHYLSPHPVLPKVPTPEEHLAKYGADVDPHQVVREYADVGGHPKALHEHLKPGETPAGSTRATYTEVSQATGNAVKDHLAGKAPPIAEPATVGTPGATASVATASAPKRSNLVTDPEHVAQLESEVLKRDADLAAMRPKTEEEQYRENVKNPEWVAKQITSYQKQIADNPGRTEWAGDARRDAESAIENLKKHHAESKSPIPDQTPGRTEAAQATIAGTENEKVRDAADKVSRIEQIPVGERTADDRSELRDAKRLAVAAEVAGPSGGAKNPAQYVDDHPEITAANPLGLPTVAERSGDSSAANTEHAAIEAKIADAKANAANKSNGKGDRMTWARHAAELEDQLHTVRGTVRTPAEHDAEVKRATASKDHDRIAALARQEPAVHASHIDKHLAKLDKRIAKMDEANTWANHVMKEHGNVKWDSQMETVYGSPKEAIESGFPKQLLADPKKGEKGQSIDQIAQSMASANTMTVPSDRNDTDYLIEKLSSGETHGGTHDDHRQSLAAERDAIQQGRDGTPEADKRIYDTIRAPKQTAPKPAAVASEPEPSGPVTGIDAQIAEAKQKATDPSLSRADQRIWSRYHGELMAKKQTGGEDDAGQAAVKAAVEHEQAREADQNKRDTSFRQGDQIEAFIVPNSVGVAKPKVKVAARVLAVDKSEDGKPMARVEYTDSKGNKKTTWIGHGQNTWRQLGAKTWNRAAGESKDPDAPDTSTTHGQASAVPIGVTDKDDFESRGRGVRKSQWVESPVYELLL